MTQASQAILGQGLFAGAHFVTNILLARWLAPAEYGIFALAYSFFLLFSMLYCACIYEPLLVYGAGRHAGQFRDYVNLVISMNLILLVPLTFGMVVTSFLLRRFYSDPVAVAFLALALSAPVVLTTWLGRATFYAQIRPGKVALGGIIYFCALLAWLFVLHTFSRPSPGTTFLGMGAAGVLTNSFFLLNLPSKPPFARTLTFNVVIADHWRYGRWAMASALVAWFPDNIYYALLPAHSGLEGAAALRAIVNLINPVVHSLAALSTVIIPVLVRRFHASGSSDVKRTMGKLLAIAVPACLLYEVLLWFWRYDIFRLLYSGKYLEQARTSLLIAGLLPITTAVVVIAGAALRAVERPDSVFWSYVAAIVSALIIGVPLTLLRGITGAAAGMLIASFIAGMCMLYFFHCVASAKPEQIA